MNTTSANMHALYQRLIIVQSKLLYFSNMNTPTHNKPVNNARLAPLIIVCSFAFLPTIDPIKKIGILDTNFSNLVFKTGDLI